MPAHRLSPLNRRPQRPWLASASLCLGAGVLALAAAQAAAQESSATRGPPGVRADREPALIRMVRQDCGSCHGMRLTGGLGPALTRDALADKPLEGLAATRVPSAEIAPPIELPACITRASMRRASRFTFVRPPSRPNT